MNSFRITINFVDLWLASPTFGSLHSKTGGLQIRRDKDKERDKQEDKTNERDELICQLVTNLET